MSQSSLSPFFFLSFRSKIKDGYSAEHESKSVFYSDVYSVSVKQIVLDVWNIFVFHNNSFCILARKYSLKKEKILDASAINITTQHSSFLAVSNVF